MRSLTMLHFSSLSFWEADKLSMLFPEYADFNRDGLLMVSYTFYIIVEI